MIIIFLVKQEDPASENSSDEDAEVGMFDDLT